MSFDIYDVNKRFGLINLTIYAPGFNLFKYNIAYVMILLAMSKAVKNWNNREICDLNRYNFLPSYSFMELIYILNSQYCSVHFDIFISLITCIMRSQSH